MRSVPLAVIASILAVALLPAGALANPPNYTWGWVTDRQPTVAHLTPAARDRGNSAGLTDTVDRNGVGIYDVHFPGLGTAPDGGTVIAAALGSQPRFCISGDIGRIGNDESIYVDCYGFDGQAADSKFSVVYAAGGTGSNIQAYLWANDPSSASYTPDPNYQFNAMTGLDDNSIMRSSTGVYIATLPSMSGAEGNLQLTTSGDSNCRIASWTVATPINVTIKCYGIPSGSLFDDHYDLMYTDNVGMTGVSRPSAAYLFANRPTASTYTPAPAYRYSSGMAPSVVRTSTGAYVVKLPGMPKGGAASVTAVGTGKSRCQLSSIATTTPQKVGVVCFNTSGHPVDSKFTFSYTK